MAAAGNGNCDSRPRGGSERTKKKVTGANPLITMRLQ
jgi:hypothetical protein